LVLTNEFIADFLGINELGLGNWIQFTIATVIFSFALIFFQHAGHEIRARKYGMMTLVSLAVGAGYLFSVASTFVPAIEVEFYLEISTLIWVLLFGHYLEAKSSSVAGNALQEVAKLLPSKAHRIKDGIEENIDIVDLSEGDVVLVKSGEKVGTLVDNSTWEIPVDLNEQNHIMDVTISASAQITSKEIHQRLQEIAQLDQNIKIRKKAALALK